MRIAVIAPLPADHASRFPDDPSGRRGAPHVTVLYVDTDHPDSVRPELVREVIERVAAAWSPMTVEIVDQVERFGGDDGMWAAALPVEQAWDLRLLRLMLRFELREAGVDTPQRFEAYEPHTTLAYLPDGEDYDGDRPAGPVTLSTLQLRIDDEEPEMLPLGEALAARPPSERLTADVEEIRGAIRKRRKVAFQYTRSTGERTTRTVRPIEMRREDAGWVLGAFCELRQAYRTFRLRRMSGVEVLEDSFEQLRGAPDDLDDGVVVALRSLRFGDDLAEEAARQTAGAQVPDGWVVGRAFRTLATGEIYCRWTGKRRGKPITEADLRDAVKVFETGEDVGVDQDHATKNPDGTVLAMWVVDDGDRHSLAVVPAYGPKMAAYVAGSSGSLWSSPEIIWTNVHDPRTGEPVGRMRVHSLAITADPAQAHRVLDRVRLVDEKGAAARRPSEGEESTPTPADQETDVEELKEMMAALTAQFAAFDERLSAVEMADGADGADDAGDAGDDAGPPEDEKYSALRAQVAQLTAQNIERERKLIIGELLSSGRIAPAEKDAVEKAYTSGGADLVSAIFGSRKAGSAVPKLKGHGEATETTATDKWAAMDKAVTERMSADPDLGYDDAFRLVLADQNKPGA